jgi:hypothetical protein
VYGIKQKTLRIDGAGASLINSQGNDSAQTPIKVTNSYTKTLQFDKLKRSMSKKISSNKHTTEHGNHE